MEIEAVRRLGSHTVFAARIVHEERCAEGLQFFMIHGIYQAWRMRQRPFARDHRIARGRFGCARERGRGATGR